MRFNSFLICLLTFLLNKSNAIANPFDSSHFQLAHTSSKSKNDVVYVCMGDYSYKYHSRTNCTGLNNCRGELYYMDSYTASNTYRRTPCCVCYNCSGSGGGGGGNGGGSNGYDETLGYVAIAIVAASAAILSNDVYLYPVFSFNKQNPYTDSKRASSGYAFGFRKTFRNCALEYGVSLFDASQQFNGWGNYDYSTSNKSWGVHFNFVHKFCQNKTPNWLKVYAGPTVNFINDFGYGGIIGAEIKLVGRLKFDTRYELTSQTNQIQTGLIFNYQRKYFWQH